MREPIMDVLTIPETLALAAVHKALKGARGCNINAAQIADRLAIQRSSFNHALRLATAAGVLRSRSRGSAGTAVEVLRPEVLAAIAEEASHYTRLGAASG